MAPRLSSTSLAIGDNETTRTLEFADVCEGADSGLHPDHSAAIKAP